MAGMIGLSLALLASDIPPPPVITPPPIRAVAAPVGQRALLMWTPGEVRCAGGAAPIVLTLRRPNNALVYPRAQPPETATLRFAIDPSGRVHSISHDLARINQWGDIAPALASSRFAPGKAQADCTVSYSSTAAPLATAPLPDLISYSMDPHSGPLPREAWQRIEGGADCFNTPRPQPRLRAFPDFIAVAATPGVRDWSMVRFDIDADGRPVRPSVATGTGNRDLDEAAMAAVADSRFTAGARTGCLYPYWRAPAVLKAQPMPTKPAEPEGCTREGGWLAPPVPSYPAAYQRRSIEGWAVIGYDIAPWGDTGNVRVIEAQPSVDFAAQAKRMIEGAKARPSETGVSGCVVHVRFAMPPDIPQPGEEPPAVAH